MLPQNSSLGITINALTVHTTVSFERRWHRDQLLLNGQLLDEDHPTFRNHHLPFLRQVRTRTNTSIPVRIESKSNFPVSAGLASSAAGFAALTLAINQALNLQLSVNELSALARQGSGSATRSLLGGFVKWLRGNDESGSDSVAVSVAPAQHWPRLRLIICTTSTNEKQISSRSCMEVSQRTSPLYSAWLSLAANDLASAERAIANRNFATLGETAERNALLMHSVILTSTPPIIYWNPATLNIIKHLLEWRPQGIESYFTIDAGPQVKVLCEDESAPELSARLNALPGVSQTIIASLGEGAESSEQHLF